MKLNLIFISLFVALAACQQANIADVKLPEGFTHLETISAKTDDIIIPYKKYKLENGLTVVLHEDKSDPLVHVDITYHVGSGREDIGKSGFAHFFEHMMFQGSENVADEEHFKIITEAGGTLNGTTNSDRTNYFETVPANQLEKILWLEADRMGYFLNAVTPEKFENQRETVKNERGQRVDNRPYGLLWERVGEAMFPEGHPYSWSTIGYMVDLDRATLNDLKSFFLRWYGPNNATLTIGGDFDEAQTLAWVKKYFGPIPAGPHVDDPEYQTVTLDKDRYISLEDNVEIPMVYMAWPTVKANHPDEAPLDVLMSILGEGKTSLLYKNLEKGGLAVNTGARHSCRELNCMFALFALPNPTKGKTLTDIEAILRQSLEEFEGRGVEDDDLVRVKAGIVSDKIYGLESVSGKVSQLAYYETFRNSPNGIGGDIKRYETVTKADVMRVYNEYIKGKPAVIMSIVPKGQGATVAAPDTWQRYERNIPESEVISEVDWQLPEDDFDRSLTPPSGSNPTIKVPPVYEAQLKNGIKILGAINKETPTTTISIRLKVGQEYDTIDKLGLAALTANMLGEATLESSAEDLSNRLQKLGSDVQIYSGDEFTTIRIRSLTKNLDETMDVAFEKLFKPKFSQDDFDRLKANTIQSLRSAKKYPSITASNIFNQTVYGEQNAFAYNDEGIESSVMSITLDDVKSFYETYYTGSIASVMAVSNLGEGNIVKVLSPLEDWTMQDVAVVKMAPFPELGGLKIYFIDKPGAAQSEIRIGKRALPYDATGEYYRAGLMNYVLGGAFNSRINLNLREDKGYTYGARSFFNGRMNRGYYRAQAGVRSDSTAASISEFLREISDYHTSGITDEELTFTKNAIGQRDARSYETPSQKLSFLSRMMTYNLPTSFVEEQNRILKNLTKAEVDALASKYLNIDDMIIVVVGDKAAIFSDIEALNYPIIELDEQGVVKP